MILPISILTQSEPSEKAFFLKVMREYY